MLSQSSKQQAGVHSQMVDLVLNEVAGAIRADEEDLQIYTSGATNIFKYPELSDGEKASQLISTLEQKDKLQELDCRCKRIGRQQWNPGLHRRRDTASDHEGLQRGHRQL